MMFRDALSETLELVDARMVYAGGFLGGGDWSVRFPPPDKIKFLVVGRGACRLALDGIRVPIDLVQGDVFVLTRNAGFVLASDLSIVPRPAEDVFGGARSLVVPIGEGDSFLLLGGHLDTDQVGGRLISESLPDYLHLTAAESGTGRLGVLIGDLVEEAAGGAPGAELACSSLAYLLLIQILRRHLSSETADEASWLRAACDPRLAPAMALMHGEPSRQWTLAELARASAMSRTAFATRFRAVSGLPPLAYLTEWRMRQAERALRRQGSSVAGVAHSFGYRSEAAFSTAFKRVMGYSPRRRVRISGGEGRPIEGGSSTGSGLVYAKPAGGR